MKTRYLWIICAAVISLAGCSHPYINAFTAPTMSLKMVDEKALTVLTVINQNEIAVAKNAQKKATTKAVRQYATLMYQQHSQNLKKTTELRQHIKAPLTQSDVSLMLEQKGKDELATLNHLSGKHYDKAYIQTMIMDHKDALRLLDGLIKNVQNPTIKQHLEATRAHVVKHLHAAEAIDKQLGN